MSTTEIKPAEGWQVTATTLICDAIEDYVTVMVYKDWSAKCAWFNRYGGKKDNPKELKRLDKKIRIKLEKCIGPTCTHVTGYRDKLQQEEVDKEKA